MGLLVDGAWQDVDMRTQGGHFVRKATAFHNYVTADGSPGPTGKGGFPAERGRYHLYVSLACPWAHRTLIFRKLKKLDDVISVSVTVPLFGKKGWEFGTEPGATLDTVNGKPTLAEIYVLADPRYSGRASVFCGTRNSAPSSTTNPPKSSGCSIRRSTRSPTRARTIIRRSCAPRSIASTILFIRP